MLNLLMLYNLLNQNVILYGSSQINFYYVFNYITHLPRLIKKNFLFDILIRNLKQNKLNASNIIIFVLRQLRRVTNKLKYFVMVTLICKLQHVITKQSIQNLIAEHS